MPQLVLFVLNDVNDLEAVLEGWTAVGVSGITIMHTTGMRRLDAHRAARDDLPLFPSLRDLLEQDELHHRTLFTLVEDDAQVDRLVAATEQIVGDLRTGNNGILFTLPVGRVFGLPRYTD
jgi:hypothetical protein